MKTLALAEVPQPPSDSAYQHVSPHMKRVIDSNQKWVFNINGALSQYFLFGPQGETLEYYSGH